MYLKLRAGACNLEPVASPTSQIFSYSSIEQLQQDVEVGLFVLASGPGS